MGNSREVLGYIRVDSSAQVSLCHSLPYYKAFGDWWRPDSSCTSNVIVISMSSRASRRCRRHKRSNSRSRHAGGTKGATLCLAVKLFADSLLTTHYSLERIAPHSASRRTTHYSLTLELLTTYYALLEHYTLELLTTHHAPLTTYYQRLTIIRCTCVFAAHAHHPHSASLQISMDQSSRKLMDVDHPCFAKTAHRPRL